MVAMTTVKLLIGAVIIHLVLWAAAAAQPQRRLEVERGSPRRAGRVTGVAARLERAFANFRETFPLFAALIVVD
jgi:uncharacterized MAPEG superfamily protein